VSRFARAAAAALLIAGLGLAACRGSGGGAPTLTWYVNPDNGGQADLAKACTKAADGKYRIETSLLPNDADGQRQRWSAGWRPMTARST
jgi:multiple sugar transport system substrate-binding protein